MSEHHKEAGGRPYAVSPRYRTAFVDGDTVFLIDERGYIALQGKGVVAILRCLQRAPHTAEAVVEHVCDVLAPDEVHAHIARLIDDGYVMEHHDDVNKHESAFWLSQGVDPRQATDRLRQARVALHVFCPLDAAPLAQQLHQMNIEVLDHTTPTPADLAVVCTDDYLRDEVRVFNRQAWAARQPWMLVKPFGATLWLGPVIVPGRTACAACLAAQLLDNRRAETFLRQSQGRTTPLFASVSRLPGTVDLALDMAALEVIQVLACDDHDRLENTLLTLDLPELNLEKHHVRRLPRCPLCGLRATGGPGAPTAQKDRHRRRRPPHVDTGSGVR